MKIFWLPGLMFVLTIGLARADQGYPYAGMIVTKSGHSFAELAARMEKAVATSGLVVVTKASASAGAAARGVAIPGNVVFGVFRNDFATRVLAQSVEAGIEAPLRLYLSEGADRAVTIACRKPSLVFKPYGGGELDKVGAELDAILAKIVADAAKP